MTSYASAYEYCLANPFEFAVPSEQLLAQGESAETLDEIRATFRADNLPVTITEEILVNELAENFWRMRRARDFEAFALQDFSRLEMWSKDLQLMTRLGASAERGFHKALKVLREMQKERGFHPATNRIHIAQANSGSVSQNTQTVEPKGVSPATATPASPAAARSQFVSQNTPHSQPQTGSVSQNTAPAPDERSNTKAA